MYILLLLMMKQRIDFPLIQLIHCGLKCHLQGDGISPLVQTSVLGKGVKHRPPPIKLPLGSGSSSSGTAPTSDKDEVVAYMISESRLLRVQNKRLMYCIKCYSLINFGSTEMSEVIFFFS